MEVTVADAPAQKDVMAENEKRKFDLSEPRVREARELKKLWRTAFKERGWPSDESLKDINDYLKNNVFRRTGWKRKRPLIEIINWAESQWGLGLPQDLNHFSKSVIPSSRPLVSVLVELAPTSQGLAPRRAFSELFGWSLSASDVQWHELLGYDPPFPSDLRASAVEMKALAQLCNESAMQKLPSLAARDAEDLWKELIWGRLQRDRKAMDQRLHELVQWLDQIGHWDLIEEIETRLFWKGAMDIAERKRNKARERVREKKRRQRAKGSE